MSGDFQNGLPRDGDPQQQATNGGSWAGWLDLLLLPFEVVGLMVRAVGAAIAAVLEAS
jgi:hypothetical protein